MRKQHGFTLSEVMVCVAIVGCIALCAFPALSAINRRAAVRSAAGELRAIFHLVRSRALARATNSGVKFSRTGDLWQYAVYDDGDGDGIRNDDIKSGVDRLFIAPRCVWQQPRTVAIALPDFAIKDPDGDAMAPDASPVQFGTSTICSFSERGKATAGTIYMTDRDGEIYAVRVYGPTAKIRVLRYDRGKTKWVSR